MYRIKSYRQCQPVPAAVHTANNRASKTCGGEANINDGSGNAHHRSHDRSLDVRCADYRYCMTQLDFHAYERVIHFTMLTSLNGLEMMRGHRDALQV